MPGTRACVWRPLPTRERPAPMGYAAAAAPRDHAPAPHMASGRGPESARRAVGLAQTMRMERDEARCSGGRGRASSRGAPAREGRRLGPREESE